MKIKKVDDKPMIIHTKKKAKIHIHKRQENELKVKPDDKQNKKQIQKLKVASEKQQKGKLRNANSKKFVNKERLSRLKQIRDASNQSIKIKTTNLRVAAATGAKAATDQLEGGKEIKDAASIAYTVATPAIKASRKTASAINTKASEIAKKKLKKVEHGKKIAKKSSKKVAKNTAKNTVKNTAKTVSKETTKAVSKEVAKNTAKTVAQTASSTAGSSAGPWGLLIGTAVGQAVGIKMDIADMKAANRMRKIKFFLDKTELQEKQKDNLFKIVRDVLFKKISTIVTILAPFIIGALLPMILIIGTIAGIVMAVVAFVYSTPLAIFLPPLDDGGDTVQDIASGYYAEFNRTVTDEANNPEGCDGYRIVYTSAEDNYYDILAIYMVVYGNGETAVIVGNTTYGNLQTIVNDMCSYTVDYTYEDIENHEGEVVTMCIKNINVTKKTCYEVAAEYGFSDEEIEWLNRIKGMS